VKDVDSGFQLIVHSSWIGNQTHTFSFQAFEVLFFQDFNTGLYFDFLCLRCTTKDSEQADDE
jgi:hypothetical protein